MWIAASPVQGRGMLNNYAVFLGLDPEPLLLRFADGVTTWRWSKQRAENLPQTSRRKMRTPTRLQRTISSELIIERGAGDLILAASSIWVAVLVLFHSIWAAGSAHGTSLAEVLLATATNR